MPDIFVNLYAEGGGGIFGEKNGRIGFVRIPAQHVMRNEAAP